MDRFSFSYVCCAAVYVECHLDDSCLPDNREEIWKSTKNAKESRQVELLQRNLAHIFRNIIRKPDESFTKKIEEKIAAVRITDFFREVGDSSECRSQSGVLALQ